MREEGTGIVWKEGHSLLLKPCPAKAAKKAGGKKVGGWVRGVKGQSLLLKPCPAKADIMAGGKVGGWVGRWSEGAEPGSLLLKPCPEIGRAHV